MSTNFVDQTTPTPIQDFIDNASVTLFLDRSLPEGRYLGLGGPGGEVSNGVVITPPAPTILMPQICMSFLFLIGGIATYYLDNMT